MCREERKCKKGKVGKGSEVREKEMKGDKMDCVGKREGDRKE